MPKVLGRYHIISELGRGGMGVVYKAVDPKLERFIAIKCLSDELSSDEITVTRFLREARNVAALNHPHIAQIFLADEDEGKPYFVMEFIDGESLGERLERDGRLLPEQARRIVTECAQALQAAYEENIVHRDIKPGNIMIDRRGRSVLTDFGIANVVHPDMEQKISKFIMGTPGYLPPEVMTGKSADHRGDLFALGAVYYEMLVGKRLVPGTGLEDTARTLLASDFPELGDLDETLDEKTFGVLGRMLAPDPAKRYQTYEALLADLGFASAAADAGIPPSVDVPTQVSSPSVKSASAQPPSAGARKAAAADPAPTRAVDPTVVAPPTTQSATPPRSGSKAGLLVFAMLVLVALGASGFAMVKFAPAQIERVAGMLGWSSDDPADGGEISAAGSRVDAPESTDPSLQASEQTTRSAGLSDIESDEASSIDSMVGRPDQADFDAEPRQVVDDSATRLEATSGGAAESLGPTTRPDVDQAVVLRDSVPATATQDDPLAGTRQSSSGQAESGSSSSSLNLDQEAVMEVAAVERSIEPSTSSDTSVPAPVELEPVPPPEGVLVVGLGDAAITDPMVREIERALRDDGHELVDRGFVSGLSALLGDSELDLNAMGEVAINAGVRHVVVARALPAGERQLNFYGRSDTAYMVQADTVTYDLVARRRLGSTEVEQIEYTGLNATQKARDLIGTRLASIRSDFDQ